MRRFFGAQCLPCSQFRATNPPANNITILPPGAVWVDGNPWCLWDCDVGYTRNTSVPTIDDFKVRELTEACVGRAVYSRRGTPRGVVRMSYPRKRYLVFAVALHPNSGIARSYATWHCDGLVYLLGYTGSV